MDLSVIVVSFNTKEILRQCLSSVFEYTKDLSFEVIVVDNASHDGSVEMVQQEFPSVKLLRNDRNVGFAAGQNRGIAAASGQHVLVLNSDILFAENTPRILIDYLRQSQPDVGVIGPRVMNSDGTLAPTARRLTPLSKPLLALSILNRHYKFGRYIPQEFLRRHFAKVLAPFHDNFHPSSATRPADFVDGMCCLLKREVFEDVGLFDEQFFFDAEIMDISKRILKHNWKIIYYPQTTVTHLKHSSRAKVRRIIAETHRSELIYYAKYFPHYVPYVKMLTRVIVVPRLLWNQVCFRLFRRSDRQDLIEIYKELLGIVNGFRSDAVYKNESIPLMPSLRST